jgi:hypothetical protein
MLALHAGQTSSLGGNMTTDVNHESIIDRRTIESFLRYYDGLAEDAVDEYYTDEDREGFRDLLSEYDEAHVLQLRQMVSDSRGDEFISEHHMADYAREYADEAFDLDGYGASAYFDYEKFSSDFEMDFSSFEYDGVTYYSRD